MSSISSEKILELFEEADIDIENFDINLSIYEQGVDSLDVANIFLNIEEEFSIKISNDDVLKLDTVVKICNYLT